MAPALIRYPANLGQPPYDKWIRFSAMSGRHVLRTKPLPEQTQKDAAIGTVGLYLPTGALKSSLALHYDAASLGTFAGGALESMSQGGKNTLGLNGGASGLSQMLSDITSSAKNFYNRADYLGLFEAISAKLVPKIGEKLVGDLAPSEQDLQNAAAALFGVRANPRTEILFDTQLYREHTLDWMLVPRSLAEAKAIDQLLYFFQFYSLPRFSGKEDATISGFMIGFPYEFEIDMFSAQNNTNVLLSHINQIGRSVLKSVDIDHAAGGKTAFIKDNGDYYPVATGLRLHFHEVRLVARGDNEIKRNGQSSNDTDNFVGPRPEGQDLTDPLGS